MLGLFLDFYWHEKCKIVCGLTAETIKVLTNRQRSVLQLCLPVSEPFSVLFSDQQSPLLAETQKHLQCYILLKGNRHETKLEHNENFSYSS